MKIVQERNLSMYLAVIDLLDANAPIVAGLHNFGTLYTPFKAKVQAIRALQQQQMGAVSGNITQKKSDLRRNLVVQTRIIANALNAHFTMVEDHTHDALFVKSVSYWTSLADTNFVGACRNMLALATTVVTDLANYGIDAANLTAYAAAVNTFELIIPKPRMTMVNKSVFTADLETNFAEAKKMLDKITSLVDILEFSNVNFYQQFVGAKKVTNLTTRPIAFRMAVKSLDGVAQSGCTVQLLRVATGDTSIYKVNKNGTLVRQNMVDGVYEITVLKNDYAPLSGKVVLIAGETYFLEVTVDVVAKVFKDGRNPKTGEAI